MTITMNELKTLCDAVGDLNLTLAHRGNPAEIELDTPWDDVSIPALRLKIWKDIYHSTDAYTKTFALEDYNDCLQWLYNARDLIDFILA